MRLTSFCSCAFIARTLPQIGRLQQFSLISQQPTTRTLSELLKDSHHDCYYFVDRSIIEAFETNEIPILNAYIEKLSLSGKHFFLTEGIAEEFAASGRWKPLQFSTSSEIEASTRSPFAYEDAAIYFNISDVETSKFGPGLRWIIECGYCLSACEDIPLDRLLNGCAFALTLDRDLVRRFLSSLNDCKALERAVDLNGLEHLADVRLLNPDGSFEDFTAFP